MIYLKFKSAENYVRQTAITGMGGRKLVDRKLKRLMQQALRFGEGPPAEPTSKASISSRLNH
jgi:hypothetical protein